MIGELVTVVIDRPLGSYHPRCKHIYYSINYGYVEGIIAGDGSEQDVYVLGVDVPVETFVGRIIAVIHRKDDVEDKWVVCPDGMSFSKEEVGRLTHFQEQYFNIEIYME